MSGKCPLPKIKRLQVARLPLGGGRWHARILVKIWIPYQVLQLELVITYSAFAADVQANEV